MAYAHTRINIGADVDASTTGPLPGQVGTITKRKFIEINQKVTQEDLGCTDEEWEMYYRDGVVSDEKLPDDIDHENESLSQYRTKRAVEELEKASEPAETPRQRASRKEEK